MAPQALSHEAFSLRGPNSHPEPESLNPDLSHPHEALAELQEPQAVSQVHRTQARGGYAFLRGLVCRLPISQDHRLQGLQLGAGLRVATSTNVLL